MEVDSSHEAERADLEADTEVEDAMKNGLKRSSSAPLINQLVAAEAASSSILHTAAARLKPASVHPASRWRRWSTSTSLSPVSPGGSSSLPAHLGQGAGWARLNRLKVEETGDVGKLEIQTEREMQRGLCIENNLSQSWEDLSLSDTKDATTKTPSQGHSSRRTDPMTPLTIGVGPFPSPRTSPSPSPSPTRSTVPGKQCFSPSMQMPVPNLSFSPSPSSSPTRRGWASRRSLSPITLRPSPLGPVKRKCMLDESESGVTPSKRHSSLLSITHQNNSYRSAPYRLPSHLGSGWATPASSPSHSAGPPSDHSGCSRESSPSPAPIFPSSPAPLYPTTTSPSLMDTTSSQSETSL